MAEKTTPDGLARNSYFDPTLKRAAVKLLPGEYHVTTEDLVQVTVLGSCVAACIRDVTNGIGGMNHFMLPDAGSGEADRFGSTARYGVHAMELLINSLLKLGAKRHNFEAKVFGGGNVMRSLNHSNVGVRNAQFVLEFLGNEKIRVVAQDLEDIYPRKVYFFPHDGKARVKKLMNMHNRTLFEREADYTSHLRQTTDTVSGGDIELFG
ncbi:MAG: chemoreceptor glutamine deamidase CheD [Betaproteobacteria bacterium]|nr:chemoreceptor glutamine deamidase CheD [Betaproteobacteria bacterium]